MLKQPGDGTANLALLSWSHSGGFGGLSECELAGSSLPVKRTGHSLCHGSCAPERLDPKGRPLWGVGAAWGLMPHPVPGVAGGSPGCLGRCFAAPGPLPYPSIFSEDFLAAPATWDVLVPEVSRLLTPPTAGVAACPVIPRGLAASWIRDGSGATLRAKCVAQLLGSKSKGNRTAETQKFPQAISRWALPSVVVLRGQGTRRCPPGTGRCPGAALAGQRGPSRSSGGLTPAQLAGGGGGLRGCWRPWRGAGVGARGRQRAGLRRAWWAALVVAAAQAQGVGGAGFSAARTSFVSR